MMSGKSSVVIQLVFWTSYIYPGLIAIIFRGGLRMRKLIVVALGLAFIATFSISTASADMLVTGGYSTVDQSLMGQRTSGPVFRTQVQIGAADRAQTARLDQASGAGRSMSNAGNGGGADFQWGSSQTEQSWKAAKTVEEAQVRGLVAGDCGGENTTGQYRSQMKQHRKGYLSDLVISNAQCGEYHATLKGPSVNTSGSNDYTP